MRILSLYKRVFNVESPTKRLNIYFLARYMAGDGCIHGTLISRVCNLGISPLEALLKNAKNVNVDVGDAGLVDSLRFLIHSDNYDKPWSTDHTLVRLLTNAFNPE